MFEDLARKALVSRVADVTEQIERVTEETSAGEKERLACALRLCWFPLVDLSRTGNAPGKAEKVAEALVLREVAARIASSRA